LTNDKEKPKPIGGGIRNRIKYSDSGTSQEGRGAGNGAVGVGREKNPITKGQVPGERWRMGRNSVKTLRY